jgi:hypothetical protein
LQANAAAAINTCRRIAHYGIAGRATIGSRPGVMKVEMPSAGRTTK